MSAAESFTLFSNAAAATSAKVSLQGGLYQLDYLGTGSGAFDLYRVGPDGSTGIKVLTQLSASGGINAVLYLPPGSYYGIAAGFSANYASLTRIPIG
jgi:hypothetical protein